MTEDKKDNGQGTAPGRIFIISAPSGTGKTTLCRAVCRRMPDLAYSVSYTTRPPRAGEIDGRDYHFISIPEFLKGIETGRWVEWAKVHGNYYGTSAHDLDAWRSAGRDVLLDIDVKGAMRIREQYPDCIMIFISPPSLSVLEERLRNRGTDTPETIAIRLRNAEKEMAASGSYDHVIVNRVLKDAVNELETIIRSARRAGS